MNVLLVDAALVVQMTPQVVLQLTALLLAGGGRSVQIGLSEIDWARGEFRRLQNDAGLTILQMAEMAVLVMTSTI